MTRIIAGSARGRRLKVPASRTRPTSDRVRESLFSSLETLIDFQGLRVLDLFAGSGALGLEALSRGASAAVLVDSANQAERVMSDNVEGVGLAGAVVERSRAEDYLKKAPTPFDLVFMDPPYDLATSAVQAVLAGLRDGWLADGAVVVVERGSDGPDLQWPVGYEQHWNRRFGDTHVLRAVWYGHDQVPDQQ